MSDSRRTLEEVKNFYKSRKGLKSQQTTKFFDSWAETYEQDMKTVNYRAPNLVVDFLNANFSGSREEALVLDVACGSGLVAKLMVELGFRHFVGVDGSKGMLEQAAKTGLYQDLRLALLGTEPLPAKTGAFDVVIMVGALHEGGVPFSIVRELCHAAKPGGYLCMSGSGSSTVQLMSMEKELQLMEEEGHWTCVDTKEMNKYMIDVYNNDRNEQNEQYINATMYLYRKSLK